LSEKRLKEFKNPDNDPRGDWASRDISGQIGHATPDQFYEITTPGGVTYKPPPGRCWTYIKKTFDKLVEDGRIWFGSDGKARPRLKLYRTEVKGTSSWTWWTNKEAGHNQEAKKEFNAIMEGIDVIFETPKPIKLISKMLQLTTNSKDGDLVLDFFAGSCSTAHAVMTKNLEDQGNRQFICVQLPEPTGTPSYPTVADLGKERIRRAGIKLRETPQSTNIDTGFRVYKLAETNYKAWEGVKEQTIDDYLETVEEHLDPLKSGWIPEDLVYEVALKEGYPLTANIETLVTESNKVFKVSADENHFYICLDKEIQQTTIDQLNPDKETLLVVRDKALTDTQAANLALQCKLKTL